MQINGKAHNEAGLDVTQPLSAGRILVDALQIQGVDRVFCVPGESYLDVLDALYDVPSIEIVVTKHEGAAANMAEADGKLTGRPGICFVTRGPGATHASIGVHTAFHDSTPMILFIGQIERAFRDRGGFQEVDYRAFFKPLAKWVAEIDDAARIPEYILRAFQVATSGRPGPVVLALPEDMLSSTAAVEQPTRFDPVEPGLSPRDIERIGIELERADSPLLIVGGSCWDEEAAKNIRTFAESNNLPVVSSFRRQDIFDNQHNLYAGHLALGISPALAERVKDSDLLLVIGSRLGEVATSGYSLLASVRQTQRLVHIHPDPNELSSVFQADVAVAGGVREAAKALSKLKVSRKNGHSDRSLPMRDEFLAFTNPDAVAKPAIGVNMAGVIGHLNAILPPDSIITNGAGNFAIWLHRFFKYKNVRTQLAPTSGAMGYGFPAAIAAKLRNPNVPVVCVAGDGDFLMYPQELATALQFGAHVIVLVVNNGLYGTIRMHQSQRFPGRVSATQIKNPDFISLARSCGAYAERVDETEMFADAFSRARSAGCPALIELIVDPDQVTPVMRLSGTLASIAS